MWTVPLTQLPLSPQFSPLSPLIGRTVQCIPAPSREASPPAKRKACSVPFSPVADNVSVPPVSLPRPLSLHVPSLPYTWFSTSRTCNFPLEARSAVEARWPPWGRPETGQLVGVNSSGGGPHPVVGRSWWINTPAFSLVVGTALRWVL